MLTTRLFCETDIDWISDLLVYGTQQKHFTGFSKNNAKAMLQDVLTKGSALFLIAGESKVRRVDITIVDVDSHPASFLFCTYDSDGGVELHLAATKREHRRKGCFTLLTTEAIKKYFSILNIYARCYNKSTFAKDALNKIGFISTQTTNLATTFILQR